MGSIYRNGKYWYFGYCENGRQKCMTTGIQGDLTDTRKKEIKRDLEIRYERGNLNKGFSLKFNHVIDDYIILKEKEVFRGQRSINTLRSDRQHLKLFSNYVLNKLGRLDITDINRSVLENYMEYRFTVDGCNQTTVGNNIRGIQGFFRYCLDKDHIEVNPTSLLKIPQSLKRTVDQIPSRKEFEDMREYLNQYVVDYLNGDDTYHWVKMISWFQIRTGMRNGEVLMMKWKQNKKTDTGGRHSFSYVYLNPSLSKLIIHFKRRRREIPIKGVIKEVLLKLKDDVKSKVYVFENNHERSKRTNTLYDNTSFSRPFKRLLNEIGIEDTQYSSHTLRHGFITDLIRRDKNIVKIGKIVGHSTTHITELYEHLISSDLEDLIYN